MTLNKIDYLTPISKNFYELVEQFNLNKNSLSPKKFFETFCKRHKNFSGKKISNPLIFNSVSSIILIDFSLTQIVLKYNIKKEIRN